jgi:hypothetical protein|nr:MAG TPA: hypothetical protein [Caudoviricetes sp.]
MAFTISLFKTYSENNRVVKTLTDEKQLSGELRNQTSVLNPSIRIESADNISTYNYAYISEFGRYYYITDIVSVRTNCWVVSLRCDVLMSYKDEIKTITGVVVRQESNPNKLLVDRLERIQSDKEIDILYYPDAFSKNLQYILVTAGGQNG